MLQEYAAEALHYIALADAALQDQVVAAGAIAPLLVACLQSPCCMLQAQAAHALGGMAWESGHVTAIIAAGGVAPLVSCLSSSSDWVQEHAVEPLQLLLLNGGNMAALVVAAGAVEPLGPASAVHRHGCRGGPQQPWGASLLSTAPSRR